ncbi:DUF262 domain-containing protein [Pulveribacter sp.]|uniref:DUF262 domain-containing protein n=1 Tax=Pulveribacter sp. TaxID=2678893 RepID=UPI0028ADE137|nr:DUF262 domain-containing protein [Pulveribacter sp.]
MDYKLEYKPVGFGKDPLTGQNNQGLSGTFFVPAYQRGYRWTRDEVHKLLDDLSDSKAPRYSLQPIVVQKIEDDTWELIDGQQRLTTLWLIFNYMQKSGYRRSGAAYRLRYQTRPGCHDYLEGMEPQKDFENIDYYHLWMAHQAIADWFDTGVENEQAKEHKVDEIHRYLHNSVHVIWYEVPAGEKLIPLFTRLNQGRIPLTDAELLKAVLLTFVSKNHQGREDEVAAQWDSIERDLQRPEIWAFVAGNVQDDERYSTRISLLFDILSNQRLQTQGIATDSKPKPYQTFETLRDLAEKEGLTLWKDVEALHAQIIGWLEEPRWYNKIGFLVFCGMSIGDIQQNALGSSKNAFDRWLDEQIKQSLKIRAEDLSELSYEAHSGPLQRALLLFNVLIYCQRLPPERFPFEKHAGQAWTLEHIHAQNAQDLTRAEQWKAWLQEHRKALQAIEDAQFPTQQPLLTEIDAAISTVEERGFGERFRDLAARVQKALTLGNEGADHSIANLALLSHKINAELSNAVFEVKRQKVVDRDKHGHYIPAATRNVFLKYYTRAGHQQPHFWGEADKADYLQAMRTTLNPYLE